VGWGAWEIAMGYLFVNLDQGHDLVRPNGNNSTDKLRGFNIGFVVGVNWYENAWSRSFSTASVSL
jgi:hypothetical protein